METWARARKVRDCLCVWRVRKRREGAWLSWIQAHEAPCELFVREAALTCLFFKEGREAALLPIATPFPSASARSKPSATTMALAAQQKRQLEFHGLDIEGISFESSAVSLGSSKKLVLGGAGNRGLEINGKFVKFTAIGIYVEDGIVRYLSPKLGGKSVEELCDKELLFEEVLSAPVEKLVRVVFLLPLTGPQYSEKVLERIGAQGLYSNLKDEHKKQFLEIFKAENFPPRSSLFLSFTEKGLKVAFSKGDDIPVEPVAAIEDKSFADAVLATIIWKDGVSPAAKVSLAERLSKYM